MNPIVTDLRRELEKARQALIAAQTHLAAHAEANAALHLATDRVMYSPLHARVTTADLALADWLTFEADLIRQIPGAELRGRTTRALAVARLINAPAAEGSGQ